MRQTGTIHHQSAPNAGWRCKTQVSKETRSVNDIIPPKKQLVRTFAGTSESQTSRTCDLGTTRNRISKAIARYQEQACGPICLVCKGGCYTFHSLHILYFTIICKRCEGESTTMSKRHWDYSFFSFAPVLHITRDIPSWYDICLVVKLTEQSYSSLYPVIRILLCW